MSKIEQLGKKLEPLEEMKTELEDYQEMLHQLYIK